MSKIGFTGTRRGMTRKQRVLLEALLESDDGEFHHGLCIGADEQAHEIAIRQGYRIIGHPPENRFNAMTVIEGFAAIRPNAPYLMRNRMIVKETDRLIATPGEMIDTLRSGTWSTIRYAEKLKRPVSIILPDGELIIA